MQIVLLPLSKISVEGRLREVDETRAAEMANSLRDRGQLTPVEVAPPDGRGMHRLIFGAHRVAAARLAGLEAIQAVIFSGTRDEERLREIDENLYRRELSPLDQATFLTERREIYERLHGKVKRGPKDRANLAQLSFFDDITQKFGLPARTVKRAMWRRSSIADAAWARIAGSWIAEKGVMLDAIARVAKARQAEVVALVLGGKSRTVADALNRLGLGTATDEAAQQLAALRAAWRRAGADARRRFAAELAAAHRPALLEALKETAGDQA